MTDSDQGYDSEQRKSVIPEFTRPNTFQQVKSELKAEETRLNLSEFSEYNEKLFRMSELVRKHITEMYAESGVTLTLDDFPDIYFIPESRREDFAKKTGNTAIGTSYQDGKAIHLIVGDDMVSNMLFTAHEMLHSIGTSRKAPGPRRGDESIVQIGTVTILRSHQTFGAVISEGTTYCARKRARD